MIRIRRIQTALPGQLKVNIKPSTFDFLRKLALNNNREWFTKNKALYEAARQDTIEFVDRVCKQLALIDPEIVDLKAEKVLMRIYRDIRFSTDKTPYKTHFAAGLSPNGKMANEPGYFLSIGPDKTGDGEGSFGDGCFMAAGFWMPAPEQLKHIRQEIDYNYHSLDKIFGDAGFKKMFPTLSGEGKLKKPPKNYSADHPQADLLKNKSFVVTAGFLERDFTSGKALETVIAHFKQASPFVAFLREASKLSG